MEFTDDLLQVKRGRPKKFKDDRSRILNYFSTEFPSSNVKIYSCLQKIFIKENYTQKLKNMISIIPFIIKLPSHILQLPLQNLFEESVKQQLISEIELVVFTLVIEKAVLSPINIPSEELIKICFFVSKKSLETNQEILYSILEVLKTQHKNFEQNLEWFPIISNFSVEEINKRFRELESFRYTVIHYSYYVDEIIRLSPPYQVSEKKLKKRLDLNTRLPKPVKLKGESMFLESVDTADSPKPVLTMFDYYSFLPLEDNEFYIPSKTLKMPETHPFDFLNDQNYTPKDDEDLETVYSLR